MQTGSLQKNLESPGPSNQIRKILVQNNTESSESDQEIETASRTKATTATKVRILLNYIYFKSCN
jgi:hypothetical protein